MLSLALVQLMVAVPSIILKAFSVVTFGFSDVTVLPFGIDSILVQGMGYVRFISGVFPPIGSIIDGFLFILAFKMIMIFLRIIPLIGRLFRK